MGYGRFNSCVGRTVHDIRLSQALLRCKDLAVQRQALKSKSATKIGDINNNNEGNNTVVENEKLTDLNQYLDKDMPLELNNAEFENCEKDDECRALSPEDEETLRINLNEEDVYSDGSYEDQGNENAPEIYVENADVINRNYEELPTTEETDKVISVDKSKTDVICGSDKLNANKYSRKNLKTSVSRTSKVTSKSCPANLQARNLEKYQQRRLLLSRSKSANRQKMFTPMSAEAHHAITETIHEMHHSTSGKKANGEVNFVPAGGRKCVKSWIAPKKTKSAYDVQKVLESASQCLENLQGDGISKIEPNFDDDNDSCHSSGGTIPEDGVRMNTILPDIQMGSARDRNTHRSSSYRLPGIGKYDIAQDDPTFEITPPGFDIRYKDVEIKEERESETPPPDIRQRAIDKCSEWLTKYNK